MATASRDLQNRNCTTKRFREVPPRFELGSLDSKSRVLTITPWDPLAALGGREPPQATDRACRAAFRKRQRMPGLLALGPGLWSPSRTGGQERSNEGFSVPGVLYDPGPRVSFLAASLPALLQGSSPRLGKPGGRQAGGVGLSGARPAMTGEGWLRPIDPEQESRRSHPGLRIVYLFIYTASTPGRLSWPSGEGS